MDMSMQPKPQDAPENVIEVSLDGPEAKETEVTTSTEEDMDLFNGEPLEEEKTEKILEAFGLDPEEAKEGEDAPDNEDDEDEVTEPLEEEKEAEEEEPEKKEEPKVELDWDSDENPYKKKFSDSAKEVNEVLLPAKKEAERLAAAEKEWMEEREEIRGILRSNPDLLNAFVEQAKVYAPVKTEAPAKPDPEVIKEAVRQELGAEGMKMLEDAKAAREKEIQEAIDDFENAHPNLTSEDRGKIATQTAILQHTEKLPLRDALERSFRATFPDRASEEDRKKIEEEARVRAAKKNSAKVVTTGAAKSTGSKPTAPELTAKELRLVKEFGLTPEEVVAQREDN